FKSKLRKPLTLAANEVPAVAVVSSLPSEAPHSSMGATVEIETVPSARIVIVPSSFVNVSSPPTRTETELVGERAEQHVCLNLHVADGHAVSDRVLVDDPDSHRERRGAPAGDHRLVQVNSLGGGRSGVFHGFSPVPPAFRGVLSLSARQAQLATAWGHCRSQRVPSPVLGTWRTRCSIQHRTTS